MIKYFKGSIALTIIGFIAAYFWAEHLIPHSGLKALFVVFFLSILEVTLSFDNAVVNAMKLKNMSKIWQQRFLTWGILIAVFGMRFVFPIAIVSIFSGLNIIEVSKLAIEDITQYSHYLHIAHPPLVSFGGTFLMMLFLDFFINKNHETKWLVKIENIFEKFAKVRGVDILITLMALVLTQIFVPQEQKYNIIISGIFGITLFLAINWLCNFAQDYAEKKQQIAGAAQSGLFMFIYLELIDASFSLDGVLGSFAISKDIIIITIGLAIGAMFVRSLTIFMVEKNTLQKYCYLEHGAHWAIGFLAVVMLISTHHEIPEIITGLVGLVAIAAAFISSIKCLKESANPE